MDLPIEYETAIPSYEEARTDVVRSLIRETPFRERAIIKDLLRLEHYATHRLADAREAMNLRRLTERYPEYAAAIAAELEGFDESDPKRLRSEHARIRERLERESWMRAGGRA